MLVRITNLIFASGTLLIFIAGKTNPHWLDQFQQGPPISMVREVIIDFITFCWFAGALGLFFRKRLAWIASVVGVGTLVWSNVPAVVMIIGLFLFPKAESPPIKEFGVGGLMVLGMFVVLIALQFVLLIGLFKIRRELI
jgi:hypothetical protein